MYSNTNFTKPVNHTKTLKKQVGFFGYMESVLEPIKLKKRLIFEAHQ